MLELISNGDSDDLIQSSMLGVAIESTGNSGTSEQNADYIYFPYCLEFGSRLKRVLTPFSRLLLEVFTLTPNLPKLPKQQKTSLGNSD